MAPPEVYEGTGEELEHAMPPAEDVAANIVAAADEIAHGLLALVEDVDGGEFPGAKQAHELGLQVNAGHGLNYVNLPALQEVPHLVELNIGHSIVSRAVFVGLTQAVREMKECIERAILGSSHPE